MITTKKRRHRLEGLPSKMVLLLTFGALLAFLAHSTSQAQVASPHNFPHANGVFRHINSQVPYSPDAQTMSMGMNGYSFINVKLSWVEYNYLLDSRFTPILNFVSNDPHFGVSGVINKDRKVWWGTFDNSGLRFTVLSTTGTILSQFKMPGYQLKSMVADTSGHVYVVYDGGTSSGFGVMRFGASYVPDYQKWVSLPSYVQSATWGMDQRLYVHLGGKMCVLDALGNVLKWIDNPPAKFSIYQDHGMAMLGTYLDSVQTTRLDSNMTLRWAKRFKSGAPFNLPYSIVDADVNAMPGSDDLAVIASVRTNGSGTCFQTMGNADLRMMVFDKNGAVVSLSVLESFAHHVMATSTPYGDPLVMTMSPFCITAATAYTVGARVMSVYDKRPNCSGGSQTYTSVGYVPSSLPSIGTGPASVSTPVAVVPDVMNISQLGGVLGGHSYECRKPCLTVTSQPQGGGLVAFNDVAMGFIRCNMPLATARLAAHPTRSTNIPALEATP